MTPATDNKSRRWHRRKGAAEYIRNTYNIPCSEPTLATKATRGGGPAYSLVGNAALYAEDDLDEWANEKLSRRRYSTSEPRRDPGHVLTREPARA
jgi:hypothetical protein